MNREIKFTYYMALWIIAICSAGMAMTYINDYLQTSGFFGDVYMPIKRNWNYDKQQWIMEPSLTGAIDEKYEWGVRHYWYWWMCFLLFCLSIVRVVMWADNFLDPKK